MDKDKLNRIERHVLNLFQKEKHTRLLAKEIFENAEEFSNADIVRAFEDLEKKARFLVRHTTEGNDYVSLTAEGAAYVGLRVLDHSPGIPHPPRSAT